MEVRRSGLWAPDKTECRAGTTAIKGPIYYRPIVRLAKLAFLRARAIPGEQHLFNQRSSFFLTWAAPSRGYLETFSTGKLRP